MTEPADDFAAIIRSALRIPEPLTDEELAERIRTVSNDGVAVGGWNTAPAINIPSKEGTTS
jgi:hypothetical protein